MKPTIFIDGEAGTTGLQIRARLERRPDLAFIRLDERERKDAGKRREAINECDVAVLCLPDDAAREAVALIDNPRVRVLDASSAHRVKPEWVYGLPEMTREQPARIAAAPRVTNPGCYPTGVILLLKPLIRRRLVPATQAVSVHAVSGYSGGGRSLIEAFENKTAPKRTPYTAYGLRLEHKHVEEMRVHSELRERPIFTPSYGNYRQGIVLQIPLPLSTLPRAVAGAELQAALSEYYQGSPYVRVSSAEELEAIDTLEPELLNGTDAVNLYVFGNDKHRQAVLAAVYDNLGKGAAGAAVQNLNLMLGLADAADVGLRERAAQPGG